MELKNYSSENESVKKLNTGTTTVSLVCKDGIIFAADKRATMGFFIASKTAEKIHQLDDRIAMTIAGSVGDAQALVRIMRAEIQLYRAKHSKSPSVKAVSTLLSNILYAYKWYPYFVQLIVAGYDSKPVMYTLDALGGMTEEEMFSTGSGSPIALGLLEAHYSKDKPIKENLKLAVKAVKMAMERDAASGEGVDAAIIDSNGFKRLSKEDIENYLRQPL
ncbi:MAG: archaeal proteasome endopeptidase complex subunit beta [Candidatus Anstonellales archaeon]